MGRAEPLPAGRDRRRGPRPRGHRARSVRQPARSTRPGCEPSGGSDAGRAAPPRVARRPARRQQRRHGPQRHQGSVTSTGTPCAAHDAPSHAATTSELTPMPTRRRRRASAARLASYGVGPWCRDGPGGRSTPRQRLAASRDCLQGCDGSPPALPCTVSPHCREEDQVRYRAGALPRVTSPVRVFTTSTAHGTAAAGRWPSWRTSPRSARAAGATVRSNPPGSRSQQPAPTPAHGRAAAARRTTPGCAGAARRASAPRPPGSTRTGSRERPSRSRFHA